MCGAAVHGLIQTIPSAAHGELQQHRVRLQDRPAVHEKLDTLTPAHKSRRRHLHEIILYAIILKLTGLNLAQMAGLF